jgi:fucose permease
VLGLGWGSLVIALNQLVAFSEGARRSALLNALNGAYSAGAVAAPVLVSTYAASHFWWLYGGAALLALLLIPFASGVSGRLELRRPVGSGRNRALIVTFVVAFVAYVAVEAGTAGWMTSHLESTGLLSRDAALLTSGFFLALVAGRLLITLTPDRVPERAIVLTCSSLAVGTLLVAASGRFAPEAYIATGLVIAPIFPTAIVWLAKANPGDPSATSWLFPATAVGGVVGPGTIGLVIAHAGLSWTPVVLSATALATLGAFLLARRQIAAATPIEVVGP